MAEDTTAVVTMPDLLLATPAERGTPAPCLDTICLRRDAMVQVFSYHLPFTPTVVPARLSSDNGDSKSGVTG